MICRLYNDSINMVDNIEETFLLLFSLLNNLYKKKKNMIFSSDIQIYLSKMIELL